MSSTIASTTAATKTYRVSVALVLVLQAALLAPELLRFYYSHGLVQPPINNALAPSVLPRLTDLARLTGSESHEAEWLLGIFALYVLSLNFLLFGLQARVAAIVAWLAQITLKTTGASASYGVFEFATIALFYMALIPSYEGYDDERTDKAKYGLLWLRVVQVHLCIVYLSSGIAKARGVQWWNGEAIWRAMMRPDYGLFDVSFLANFRWIAMIACWSVLLIETGYAVAVWLPWTRRIWPAITIMMHAGIAVFMGLWSFGALMVALNLSIFVVPRLQSRASELVQDGLLIFYDTDCLMCSRFVRFVKRRDKRNIMTFYPLADRPGSERNGIDSIVVVEIAGERRDEYVESDAVFRIARQLQTPWSTLYAFVAVPKTIRDGVYRMVARNRKRFQHTECTIQPL